MKNKLGQYSTLGEAMRADVKASHDRGVNLIAAVAEATGKSTELVYKWTEETRSANVFDFWDWCRLAESNHAANWLVRALGYEPVRRRDGEYTTHDVETRSLPLSIKEFSEAISKTCDGLADGTIDSKEAKPILKEIEDAITALSQLGHDIRASLTPSDGRCISLADTQRKARES